MIGRRLAHGTFLSVLQHPSPIFCDGCRKNSDFSRRRRGGSSQQKCMVRKAFSRRRGGFLAAKAHGAQSVLAAHAGFPDAFAFIDRRWASASPRAQQKDACVYKRLFRLTRCFFGKSSTWRMRKMRTVPAICPQARTPRCKAPQARTPPQCSPPCRSMRRRPLA